LEEIKDEGALQEKEKIENFQEPKLDKMESKET
jgi:hypothetical protein